MSQKAQSNVGAAILSRGFIDPTSSALLKVPLLVKSARRAMMGTRVCLFTERGEKAAVGNAPSPALPADFLLTRPAAPFRSSNQFTLPLLSPVKMDNLFDPSKQEREGRAPSAPLTLPRQLQLHTVGFFCPRRRPANWCHAGNGVNTWHPLVTHLLLELPSESWLKL